MMPKKNIGTAGRVVRALIAALLFLYAWWEGSWLATLLGLFVLYEVFASWCLFYQLFGWNSCPRD